MKHAYVPGLSGLSWRPLPKGTCEDALVCFVDFDPSSFDPRAFAACGIHCPPNIARSVPKRQAEYFFGRYAAREALAARGSVVVDVPTGSRRQPVWPQGFVGSISHESCVAAAVVLPEKGRRGVGIDIEAVVTANVQTSLLATVVDTEEVQRLALWGLKLDAALTALFSAKESFFKATFERVGRYFDFTAARLVEVDEAGDRLALEVQEDLCPELVHGTVHWVNCEFIAPGRIYTSCVW
jgi:enterobactin synthetase component D